MPTPLRRRDNTLDQKDLLKKQISFLHKLSSVNLNQLHLAAVMGLQYTRLISTTGPLFAL